MAWKVNARKPVGSNRFAALPMKKQTIFQFSEPCFPDFAFYPVEQHNAQASQHPTSFPQLWPG